VVVVVILPCNMGGGVRQHLVREAVLRRAKPYVLLGEKRAACKCIDIFCHQFTYMREVVN